jgi:hypothetical protein
MKAAASQMRKHTAFAPWQRAQAKLCQLKKGGSPRGAAGGKRMRERSDRDQFTLVEFTRKG